MYRVKCQEKDCDWSGNHRDLLKAEHPFRFPRMAGVREYIFGCPECESAFEEPYPDPDPAKLPSLKKDETR